MFTNDQLRVIDNVEAAYDQWLSVARRFDEHADRLQWKSVKGREYLYRIKDGAGNGESLGPRTAELEAFAQSYKAQRDQAKTTLSSLRTRLDELARQYRALRLPRIDDAAARVLAMADRAGRLGADLIVVGTNAMVAYEIEAQDRFATGLDATEDCDFTWAGDTQTAFSTGTGGLLALLKRVDKTYTINTKKPHQVRNAQAYAVDFLTSEAGIADYPKDEPVRALPLPGQEWLVLGEPVSHVVTSRRGLVAQITAPDPRYFALHKVWLSERPDREATKASKDLQQAQVLWRAVQQLMKRYPVDAAFIGGLPAELRRGASGLASA